MRHVGLSEVSVADIKEAQDYVQVVTVQNRYSPTARHSDDVLAYCEAHTIGFIPWAPLGSGVLARPIRCCPISPRRTARRRAIAIAWSLAKSPAILAIPGTSKVAHLEENAAAAGIALTDDDLAAIEDLG